MTHLHFTFGPVQGFVAQARRTRDLYAGSFLLSHLARTAMKAAQDAGGTVLLPDLTAIERLADTTEHAVAPNRFVAQFDEPDGAASAARNAASKLQEEWRSIADKVWKRFLDQVPGKETETPTIWDRQIGNFWEIAWAVGDAQDTDLLDRRKNWRTPPWMVEHGDHCTLMGRWQELSGFIRSRQQPLQAAYWKAVQQQVKSAGASELDLEDDERLCAIAFVKRFFPLVSQDAIGRDLGMDNWPSTVSIAAVPWLKKIKTANAEVLERCKAYTELARDEPGAWVSSPRRIRALGDFPAEAGGFPNLSGNFLNRTALKNDRGTRLKNKDLRPKLLEALARLEGATRDRAGNCYALLLMDGDYMGRLIRKYQNDLAKVTQALATFSEQAPDSVDAHDGVCVYAGGDDLLAMLALDRALEAAAAVRNAYRNAFQAQGITADKDGTISAGLVFAHYRCAFSRVLKYAHELLDGVAKDGAGRDALAIGVLKPGGVTCQWVGKFDPFIQNGSHCFQPLIEAYQRESDRERHQVNSEGPRLSSSFLHNLRERYAELFEEGRPPDACEDADAAQTAVERFDEETLTRLFVAEYLHGRIDRDPAKARQQRDEAEKLMGQLIAVCWQPDARRPGKHRFDLDGARLVKFLALDGKEGAE